MDRKRVLTAALAVLMLLGMAAPMVQAGDNNANIGEASPIAVSSDDITIYEVGTYSATGMYEDEPLIYIPVEGKKLYVYKLNTWEKFDELDTVFSNVSGITVDGEGNLWMAGRQPYIQKYNPTNGEMDIYGPYETTVPSTSGAFDLIVGDNGKLYFGTYGSAAVGEFDPSTGTFQNLGIHNTDAAYSCGLAYDPDGYIYAALTGDKNTDGEKTNEVVKIRISDGECVGRVDISDCVKPAEIMVRGAALVGNTYIAGGIDMYKMVAINVDTMKQTTLYYDDEEINNVVNFSVSEAYEGKHYMTLKAGGNVSAGLYSIEDATGKVALVTKNAHSSLHCGQDSIIEINGAPCVMMRGSGVFKYWNLNNDAENGEQVSLEEMVSNNDGTGVSLQSLAKGENGQIFIGAFNASKCMTFDTAAGKISDTFYTNGQTDTMIWYKNQLYAGNYKGGVLIRVNMEDSQKNEVLLDFKNGTDENGATFDQVRVHAIAAGDNKVFAGTMPDSGKRGGCIGWYDIETGDTYIERNVVPNQSINSLYYDEENNLLYGTTTTKGGTGTGTDETLSAQIFIYDVDKKKVVGTIDLVDYLDLKGSNRKDAEGNEIQKVRIPFVAGIAPDPDFATNGIMWGMVAERLFTFTCVYDKDTEEVTVQVTEKICRNQNDPYLGDSSRPKDIAFRDGYVYVAMTSSKQIHKIKMDDSSYTILPIENAQHYLIDNDVLYYSYGETLYAYPLVTTEADEAAAQAVANAIASVDAASVDAVRASYEALTWGQKALIKNLGVLEAAEDALLVDKIKDIENAEPATINTLMRDYKALTAERKKNVSNYSKLRDAFNEMKSYAIGETQYANLEDAVEDASAGTIKLLKDTEENDVEVCLFGAKLDLNGCILTADTLIVADSSHVIDSTNGNGLAKVQGEISLYEKNEDMPLLDRVNGGYRFYDYQLTVDTQSEAVDNSTRKFWYRFAFTNTAAYELLVNSYPGMTIGTEVYLNNVRKIGVNFGAGDPLNERDFAAAWAKQMQKSPDTTWIYAQISNLDNSNVVGTLGVKPYIKSCGVLACTEPDMITYRVLGISSGFAPRT